MSKFEKFYHYCVLITLLLVFLLPIGSTLLYSFSTQWGATLFPDGITLKWYFELFYDQRFMDALMRSLIICFSTLVLAIVVIFPTVFCINFYFTKMRTLMNILIVAPFAIPPIVSCVGLLQIYSGTISQTPYILIGCYFCIALPFIYRSLDNSINAINLNELIMSNKILGGSLIRAIFRVILPNMKNGILIAMFLSFSFLIGEFVFANILIGTQWETLQVYIYNMRNKSGHYLSAMVIIYFLITLITTFIAIFMLSGEKNAVSKN